MSENELRELFAAMREDPVPADSLVRMRAKLGAPRASRFWPGSWKFAFGAALILASACFWLILTLVRPVPPPARIPVHIAAGAPRLPFVIPAIDPVRQIPARRRHKRTVVRRDPTPAPVLIRIETPDPDVVILLVGD